MPTGPRGPSVHNDQRDQEQVERGERRKEAEVRPQARTSPRRRADLLWDQVGVAAHGLSVAGAALTSPLPILERASPPQPRGSGADVGTVGIENATNRMREIQSMASAMRTGLPAVPTAASTDAFAARLQASLGPGGAPVSPVSPSATPPPAALLAQMQAGSQGLGVQSLLAGAPVQAPPAPVSRLTGDLDGLDPQLRASLESVATQLGRSVEIVSGARTRAEQEVLYQKYLAGTGNLAAVPGTSRHESGRAADVYVDGVALADVPGGREAASAVGLGFPVPGEAWHVEPVA